MKFKSLTIILPVALAVAACSSGQSGSATGSSAATTSASTSLNTVATPTPTPTPIPSTVTTTTAERPIYAYYLNGTGTQSVYTTSNDIVADSMLRVSITPTAAGETSGTGGVQNYTQMSVTVTLMQNGAPIASVDIPVQSNASTGYTSGVPVGQLTDPSFGDFSSYLSGNGKYSIMISNVETDYKCNTFCTQAQYGCSSEWVAYGSCPAGWSWNWDYHQNSYTCCPSEDYGSWPLAIDSLNLCQRQQCGVGPVTSTANWSLTVKVETDITEAIH